MDNRPRGLLPLKETHLAALAQAMLPEHAAEVWDVSGITPETALRLSFAASLESYVYVPYETSRMLFAMGVATKGMLDNGAMVWLLSGGDMNRHTVGLLRAARWGLRRAFSVSGADCLVQYIPEWYQKGLRFARRLGFTIEPGGLLTCRGSRIYQISLHRDIYDPRDLLG